MMGHVGNDPFPGVFQDGTLSQLSAAHRAFCEFFFFHKARLEEMRILYVFGKLRVFN